jgi:hypothetical protein
MQQKEKSSIKERRRLFYIKFIPNSIKLHLYNRKIRLWVLKGRTPPPPLGYKHNVILSFAKKFNHKIFIETGTYQGETLYMMKNIFEKLYSVELSNYYYENAKRLFRGIPNILLIHGDSGKQLEVLLKKIDSSVLFWLDGHYSGGKTAKGKIETPIIAELKNIFNNKFKHTILIDDARCFIGKNGYPTLKQLKKLVKNKKNYRYFEVKNDIIRIW